MFWAKRQPKERFERWVHEHQTMVFSIALRITREAATAEDVAQEVFMKLYLNATITDDAHATAWLRRTTVHRSIDVVRRIRLRSEEKLDHDPQAKLAGCDPIFANTRDRLMACLSPEARSVLVLRYQEDLDPADIALLLSMPITTVKSYLKRSLAFFRSQLEHESQEVHHG